MLLTVLANSKRHAFRKLPPMFPVKTPLQHKKQETLVERRDLKYPCYEPITRHRNVMFGRMKRELLVTNLGPDPGLSHHESTGCNLIIIVITLTVHHFIIFKKSTIHHFIIFKKSTFIISSFHHL